MSIEPGTEMIVLPATGEVIELTDPKQVLQAVDRIKELERDLRSAKTILVEALVNHSRLVGQKTIEFGDGRKATVNDGRVTVYDAQGIMEGLREAGMPEERITEIVEETVTYKVKAVEAQRAAKANPDYARVIDENTSHETRAPSVQIK